MKGFAKFAVAVLVFFGSGVSACLAGGWQFGLGVNTGVSRLEADVNNAKLGALVSGHLRALPTPYLALSGELGYSLMSSSDPRLAKLHTRIVPLELSAIFNFLPFRKINPYVFAGGGGVFWNASTIVAGSRASVGSGFDSFLKTGGGLEFRLTSRYALNIGATYRMSLTDAFDQIWSGDENDQVLDVEAGFTYYFGNFSDDRDHDSIPDELDLMPDIAEDRDGYLDHDGIPEKNPAPLALSSLDSPVNQSSGLNAPIVIHHLITKAENGKDLSVKANVFSDVDLRVVAALYRPAGTTKWNIVKLEESQQNLYQGDIPGYAVTSDGLEYCVVAVDETLSGIGYSGLPSKPISVEVVGNGTPWRVVGGVVGAATLGTASYLVLRKQK